MSRPLRIEYPYAFYHIISRGHRHEYIFNSNSDKEKYLKKLKEAIFKYSVKLHAYVLMDNHYHLLLETPLGNLSLFMHNLNTSYCNWFKAKYQIIGSIFQGRFKSILIDKDAYLLSLSNYIHLNPVRTGFVKKPEDYKYSSCKSYCTGNFDRELIDGNTILGYFSDEPSLYKNHLYNWYKINQNIKRKDIYGSGGILGDDVFQTKIYKEKYKSRDKKDKRELPELDKLENEICSLSANDIKNIVCNLFNIEESQLFIKKRNNIEKYLYMYGLKHYTNLHLKDIGKIFGLDYSTISSNVDRFFKRNHKEISKYLKQLDIRIKKCAK